MHNAAFEALGLDWRYLPFDVEPGRLGEALKGIVALGLRGVNVTIPHKEAVIPYLDEVSEEVKAIGAVNTIVHRDGKRIGYNTDAIGFYNSLHLSLGLDRLPEEVVVLGAGGAARAVVYALVASGEVKRVSIFNRTPERAEELARQMQPLNPWTFVRAFPLEEGLLRREMEGVGLLVNTTSVGMHPHSEGCIISNPELIPSGILVYDLVYNPLETVLLRIAKERGARPVNGLEMLLYQGAESFRIWTGREPPIEVMRGELRRRLG